MRGRGSHVSHSLLATVTAAALLFCGANGVSAQATAPQPQPIFEKQSADVNPKIPSKSRTRSEARSGKKNAASSKQSENSNTRLSLAQQRKRAALQQRLLLQERAAREQNTQSDRQLRAVRDQQAEALRLQQDQQRRTIYQQRRQQLPQEPGAVPRLTPGLDRPLIEQRNPSCGVAGMPLC